MGIEIKGFSGTGYKPLIDCGDRRVALVCYDDRLSRENLKKTECHGETDEVFIPPIGNAALYIGKEMNEYRLESGKLYNVKCGTRHAISMEKDAKVAVAENRDTSAHNTEYCFLKRLKTPDGNTICRSFGIRNKKGDRFEFCQVYPFAAVAENIFPGRSARRFAERTAGACA